MTRILDDDTAGWILYGISLVCSFLVAFAASQLFFRNIHPGITIPLIGTALVVILTALQLRRSRKAKKQ